MSILKLKLIVIILFAFLGAISAQDFPKNYFTSPLDIPLYLSGNFGELRSNHYHSGIDIKTQGREGHKILAAASGFVSRVKVSPYGYGNAIYIDHPNGYTTVYGHLKKFSQKIDSVVKQYQYSKESFEIDEILLPNTLRVKKGEVIALSGNSGSSGGPHLHFEVRETKSEYPTNPLLYGFDIKDDVPPVIRALFIYPLDISSSVDGTSNRKSYEMAKSNNSYSIKDNEIPVVSGKIGFALDARDYMSNTHNYYGIYHLDLYVDNELKHRFTFDKFSFDESRYINAHIDYDLYIKQKQRIHKLFHEQHQKESFAKLVNKGIVFSDNTQHNVRVEIADANKNRANLNFKVQSKVKEKKATYGDAMLPYSLPNYLKTKGFFATIPAFTFYKDIPKQDIKTTDCTRKDSYSPCYSFLDETVPLHQNITIGIRPDSLTQHLKNKAFLARKNQNRYYFIGNKWEDSFLTAKTNKVGEYVILVDNTIPSIEIFKGSSYQKTGELRYKITDNLSGIASFRGEIDGKWVLFEYDPKRNLLWHTLSSAVIVKGKEHNLVLEVKDNCGNMAIRKATFVW